MARPQKEGMDYFPHDTDAVNDEKIDALRTLYGNDGYAFYFILLERIYRTTNFELDVSDAEIIQILANKIGINTERFNQMLNTALKFNCFDKELYNKNKILTSNGIQKRASVVVDKRIKMRSKYNSEKENDSKVSDAETREETKAETPQSKEKKSKEKIYIVQSEQLWKLYPEKKGKSKAINKLPLHIKKYGYEQMERAINRYIEDVSNRRNTGFPELKYQNASTFFNGTFEDYLDENYQVPDQAQNQKVNKTVSDCNSWSQYPKYN